MRPVGLVLAVAVVLGSPSAASGESRDVRLARGIGPLDLGMTEAQVRTKLGTPQYVRKFAERARTFWRLDYENAGYFPVVAVRNGKRVVVVIETWREDQRTPERIGVGSRESAIQRVYPSARCREVYPPGGGPIWDERSCVVGRGGRAQTIFVVAAPLPFKVVAVVVRDAACSTGPRACRFL